MRCLILLAGVVLTAAVPLPLLADAFDNYTNPVIARVAGKEGVQEIKQLTPALIADNDRVIPEAAAALIVVHTNDSRYSKLLVRSAFRKVDADRKIPMLLIDRFVTYKEGQERTITASGQDINLFPGFRFNLDIGQVVPAELGGDLRFVADGDKVYAEPLGKAKMFLLSKPLPDAIPKKGPKLQVGETFEPRYFNGTFKLYDDGRRSGKLVLQVGEGGDVTGAYYSDKDGAKYEVQGKLGSPGYSIQFTIKFPRSEQVFQGWLFTGDGKALCGSSRMQDREAGFYAVRTEE
ncbi:MAG: hypothetical protein ACJ8FY_10285 [Gemmataceae bacterium]